MNKKGIITIGTILFLALSTPLLGTGIIQLQTVDQIYETVEETPEMELGLVLGAAVYGDRLSDILADRVETGIELYNSGKLNKLIMSGAENEVEAMTNYAIGRGVKANDIIKDPKGLNTFASVKNITEKDRDLTIITQKYHLPRSLFIANASGFNAVGVVADKQNYIKIFEFKKREILATSKAIFDVYKNLLGI